MVDELKQAIVAKKPNRFRGIDADDLVLWRKFIVSRERGSLQASELRAEDLLDAADEIRDYFEAAVPKNHIHIVIMWMTRQSKREPGKANVSQECKICLFFL